MTKNKNQDEDFHVSILDAIIHSISDAILAVDNKRKILFFNSKFSNQIYPVQHSSKIEDIFHDQDTISLFENALRNKPQEKLKTLQIHLSNEIRYYSFSVSPFYGKHKEVIGAVGIFHDVTELKEAEQMRIDFVANVSHEIRTPLTSIKGYADTIWGDLKNGTKIEPELFEPIIRNCERLENITKDLLDLSSLDAKHAIEKEVISIPDITRKIFNILKDTFNSRSQLANFTCDCIAMEGDEHRIEQVLTNLLDNASKYTPIGGSIEAHWYENQSKEIVLEVKDNGPGISSEHLPRLFERFYRVDKGRSRNLGGTGLGLSIVKHIMLAHKGTVSVRSHIGKGSLFICVFPQFVKS